MPLNEPQKSRGRPRVPEEERKRHTLTFRMRKDLRDAVEELAEANGRTLSEQVEYYVDAAVFSEANLIYHYSTDAMSQTLRRCISNRISGRDPKEDVKLSVDFPAGHREMLTIQGQTCLNHPHTEGSLQWVRAPGGREDAVATARVMLGAIRKGAVDALVSTLGSEVVEAAIEEERRAALIADLAKISLSTQSINAKLDNNNLIESMIEEFRKLGLELGDKDFKKNQYPNTSSQEAGYSIAALTELINGLTATSPDLSVLCSSSWPYAFVKLPLDTQNALFRLFADEAVSLYETVMRPELPRISYESAFRPNGQDIARGMRMSALRRMQELLVPLAQRDDAHEKQSKGRVQGRD